MEYIEQYIEPFIQPRSELFQKMEQYALENHVPIMGLVSVESFLCILSMQQPKTILEIGTAIGYSALRMADKLPNTFITTIERDAARLNKAENFIASSPHKENIQLLEADAIEVDVNTFAHKKYDAIFIDAAKGQYQVFFDKYEPLLSENGVIYCDNMIMRGMAPSEMKEVPRRKRTMVRKLKLFTEFLMNHPDYDTTFLPVGDGITITRKKVLK